MAKKCDHSFLTLHSGTEQSERLKANLLPENFNLNDFSIAEWMEFAYNFAKEVHYFDIGSETDPLGNWETFFVEENNIASFISEIEKEDDLTPHLTLFVTFLKLLEFSKSRFNKITGRHLDFYYQEILQIDKKSPLEDQVHLIFELAKNAKQAQIKAMFVIVVFCCFFVRFGRLPAICCFVCLCVSVVVIDEAKIELHRSSSWSMFHHR